ncbi:MAG: DEAD/DEAH box helicase [Clostridiales bacterium]|nr:DEAD/DEAH box helicase [Clostridiales bacterium]
MTQFRPVGSSAPGNGDGGEKKSPILPGRLTERKDWRYLFSEGILNDCVSDRNRLQVIYSNFRNDSCKVTLKDNAKISDVEILGAPSDIDDNWDKVAMRCSACDAAFGSGKNYCVHKALALTLWEEAKGPRMVTESFAHQTQRMEQERNARIMEGRELLRREKGMTPVPLSGVFEPVKRPGVPVFWDIDKACEGFITTPYYIARMEDAKGTLRGSKQQGNRLVFTEGKYPDKWLDFDLLFYDIEDSYTVKGRLSPQGFDGFSTITVRRDRSRDIISRKRSSGTADPDPLNEFELAAVSLIREKIADYGSAEGEDRNAVLFFDAVNAASDISAEDQEGKSKGIPGSIKLEPRVIADETSPKVGFRIFEEGGKGYVVKDPSELLRCRRNKETYPLSKTSAIDFSSCDIEEDSMPVLRFIESRLGEAAAFGGERAKKAGAGGLIPLELSALDSFYDLMDGSDCEFVDKGEDADKSGRLYVGHSDMKFDLKSDRMSDARGDFAGITLSGKVPVLMKGSSYKYILSDGSLSRLTEEEEKTVEPFSKASDGTDSFKFNVGLPQLGEFYYRVLPKVTALPGVVFSDNCREEAEAHLPPEPSFEFFLDYVNSIISCKAKAGYGEEDDIKTYVLGASTEADPTISAPFGEDGRPVRDTVQETRVRNTLGDLFQTFNDKTGEYLKDVREPELFDFMRDGIRALSAYGIVKGTDAFNRNRVKKAPQVKLNISSGSDLLDLSLTSKDMSKKELNDLFESYTLKKKYHRLSDGQFIDLSDDKNLQEVTEVLEEVDTTPEQVLKEEVAIPASRALYLDKVMEGRKYTGSERDKTYRNLLKNFRTIDDSEFDIPDNLENTLRDYQKYGFKWLKTVKSSGFGGILADEMGLGKTVQMITLLQDNKDGGSEKPSLVVCPASLVYNWKEEIAKFAPDIRTTTLTGSREERLASINDPSGTDVYVVSYDLLKRDIDGYGEREFDTVILDEAQYIKNSDTAGAKAVKSLKAGTRFAMTGTPIENRLTELWSIFDFLMPGFLYSESDFQRKFQIPISRNKKSRATQKLKDMVSPFILRRLKTDVLKDLPEKIEEVRYVELKGKQQMLYDAQVTRLKSVLDSLMPKSPQDRFKVLAELTRFRQICCDPSLLFDDYDGESCKLDGLMEFIDTAMDEGHRMLLFSQFTSMLDIIMKRLDQAGISYYVITGATSKEDRLDMVNKFNADDTPIFLISLKAGGTGLNLTGADVVIHYDPWWNVAAQNQATDRAHRIGQTRQVTVIKMIAKDTIEEKIMKMQQDKKDLADAVLEGGEGSLLEMTGEELMKLI